MLTPPLSVLDLAPVVEGGIGRRFVPQHPRPGPARRSVGLHAVLACRASQHAWHRQLGHGRADRLRRRGHIDHSRRRRRRDAAQSLAAGHRRAVRHARVALSGRIDLGLGRAPGTDAETTFALRRDAASAARTLSAGRAAAAGVLRARGARPACPRRPRRRAARAGVAAGIQPVQRTAGRDARAAVCLCVTLRTGLPDGRARRLPARVSAVRRARAALRDCDAQRRRRRQRRRGGPPVHVAAAAVRPASTRHARASFRRRSIPPTLPGRATRR